MKRISILSLLLMAAALTVLSGCDPTLNTEGGRKVKFTAVSKSDPATKTAYGSVTDNTLMIAWSENDKLRIYSPKDENGGVVGDLSGSVSWTEDAQTKKIDYVYADYTVKDIDNSSSAPLSKATLKNVQDNGLSWAGTSGATFYAAYPYDTEISVNEQKSNLCFVFKIPAGNADTPAGSQDGDPAKVSAMPLLSIKENVSSGSDVNLDFYPFFSTFEVQLKSLNESLTLTSAELFIDPTGMSATEKATMWLTGSCYYDLNLLKDRSMVVSDNPHYLKNAVLQFKDDVKKNVEVSIDNKVITSTEGHTVSFFTIPCTIDHLCFRVDYTYDGEPYSKMLRLKKSNEWVSFAAGHKTVLTGLAVNPDLWCFSTITLNGKVLDWVDGNEPGTTSGVNPEASQFAITGVQNVYQQHGNAPAYKQYRQTWPLETVDSTATVSFKIMSPRSTDTQTATYTITPKGDYNSFIIKVGETTVTGPWTGNLASTGGATRISFTVTPTAEAIADGNKKMWFTTSVTAADGTVFNIDSETQLYDMRGYHYFVTKCPCGAIH